MGYRVLYQTFIASLSAYARVEDHEPWYGVDWALTGVYTSPQCRRPGPLGIPYSPSEPDTGR